MISVIGGVNSWNFAAKRFQDSIHPPLYSPNLAKVLEQDSTFIERFAALPKHGRKRRYVAARPEELYPGRPDLAADASYQLRSGWWIGTNASKSAIAKIIEMACNVAGVRFGSDLIIELNSGVEK